MNKADIAYLDMLSQVMNYGQRHESRVGATRRLVGHNVVFDDIETNFPLFTIRKLYPAGMIGELVAFLQGATTLKQFEDAGCNYWWPNAEQWAVNKGIEPANMQVGKIYGYQWRNWNGHYDQIVALINGLKNDPNSRRHLLTTYNPAELSEMCLPPCHIMAQFIVSQGMNEQVLDCIVTMRSLDVILGLPSDAVVYGLLLKLVAKEVGMTPRDLHFHVGDCHIYETHVQGLKDMRFQSRPSPLVVLKPEASIFNFKPEHVEVLNYEPGPAVKFQLSV